jgi:hypothetical protein
MLELSKYSLGVGDRFGSSAGAQLRAIRLAATEGVDITPVWNKSNREHEIIGSEPADTAVAARRAVEEAGWDGPYHVDADHVTLSTVGRFVESSDYFTIDVADSIGVGCPKEHVDAFLVRHPELIGEGRVEGLSEPLRIDEPEARRLAGQYLAAAEEAGHSPTPAFRCSRSRRSSRDASTKASTTRATSARSSASSMMTSS